MPALLAYSVSCAVISAAILFVSSHQRWQAETERDLAALLHEIETNETTPTPTLFQNIPAPIQRHLQQAITTTKTIKTLRIEQAGLFLLNGQWIPFTATQLLSAANSRPGFVWDASMQLPILPFIGLSVGINVRDTYVGGTGTMLGKLLAYLTIVDEKDTPSLNEGELSRWLAEAVVFPTALLPSEQLLWKTTDDARSDAAAVLADTRSETTTEIKFSCDPSSGLIRSIYALRPFLEPSGEAKVLPWEGHFFDYERRDGVLVPTRMEVGWWKDNALELYFKGTITEFNYTFY